MFIGFEQVGTTAVVKNVQALTPPRNATHCTIQADTQSVRYRMDGGAPTAAIGMLFLTTQLPELFLIEDLKRIQFCQGAGGAGNLNIHYAAGRDI